MFLECSGKGFSSLTEGMLGWFIHKLSGWLLCWDVKKNPPSPPNPLIFIIMEIASIFDKTLSTESDRQLKHFRRFVISSSASWDLLKTHTPIFIRCLNCQWKNSWQWSRCNAQRQCSRIISPSSWLSYATINKMALVIHLFPLSEQGLSSIGRGLLRERHS